MLENWGPTWYSVMLGEEPKTNGGNSNAYAGQTLTPGTSPIYTDTVKADGSTRPLDGFFISYSQPNALQIPIGYNPEIPALVNP